MWESSEHARPPKFTPHRTEVGVYLQCVRKQVMFVSQFGCLLAKLAMCIVGGCTIGPDVQDRLFGSLAVQVLVIADKVTDVGDTDSSTCLFYGLETALKQVFGSA